MPIRDVLQMIKQELQNEYGFDLYDFRLEEIYPPHSGMQEMTVSFLIPEEKPITNMFNITKDTEFIRRYDRIYKTIDFDMNTKKISQMKILRLSGTTHSMILA